MNRLFFASIFSLAACSGTGTDGKATGADTIDNSSGVGAAPSTDCAPSLATLTGEISQSTFDKLPPKVRVALVWPVAGNDHEAEGVDVALPQLPVRYILNVSSPPPADAFQDASDDSALAGVDLSGVSGAAGMIIAYVDADGNGKRASDDSEPVLAISNGLYFVKGTPPAQQFTATNGSIEAGLQPGFNVIGYGAAFTPLYGNPTPAYTATAPLADDLNLGLRAPSKLFGTLACATGFGVFATPLVDDTTLEPVGVTPPPGATIQCFDDGLLILWSHCSGLLCSESCTSGEVNIEGTTPPVDWPCALTP